MGILLKVVSITLPLVLGSFVVLGSLVVSGSLASILLPPKRCALPAANIMKPGSVSLGLLVLTFTSPVPLFLLHRGSLS